MDFKENITGLQHIGIPTEEFQATVKFYKSLGFCEILRTEVSEPHQPVSFLKNGNLIMEVYGCGKASNEVGAIDHIALNVVDIDAAFEDIKEMGLVLQEDQIGFLPFWDNGIRYFTVFGPNNEKVEFCQRL